MPYSAKIIIKILIKDFGFEVARQQGSHIVLRKQLASRKVVTVVPNHKEVKPGTLRSILKLAEVSLEEFEKRL